MSTSRLDDFTAAIGFFDLPPPESRESGLAPSWRTTDLKEALSDMGWILTSDLTWYELGGDELGGDELGGGVRDLVFFRGEEAITVTIFVSAEGEAPARNWFLMRADSTSTPEIPYRRIDLASGRIAVEMQDPLTSELLWLFHNIAFHVKANRTQISVREIAAWLQKPPDAAEFHDLALSRPRTNALASNLKRKIGEILRVPILEQPPEDLRRQYEVEVSTEGEAIDFVGFRENEALFEAQTPGFCHLTIYVIDRDTLLSNRIEANVEVEPSEPRV